MYDDKYYFVPNALDRYCDQPKAESQAQRRRLDRHPHPEGLARRRQGIELAARACRHPKGHEGAQLDPRCGRPELYIVGGEFPTRDDPRQVGPYIAKADATTGKQIWRTYLDNFNVSGRWIANANLNILPNGNIAFAWSHFIALVDGDTGGGGRQGDVQSGLKT